MPPSLDRFPIFVSRFVDAVVTEPLADMITGRLRLPKTSAPSFVASPDRRRPAAA